ncbi:MAG: phosphatidylinositol mannoside acyltransferase [Nitriliruptor sp.]|uniref:phosphatidylinositol mannoside acyltransferase n=1 Tax=Nitriliruptor sp. TaxID=2448056 RepID=UPI0034A0AB3F
MRQAASLEDLPPPPDESLGQKAVYWQYRSVWEAAARLPDRLARRVPGRVGALWYRFASDAQREQVRRNLDRVTRGHLSDRDLDRLVRDAYVSYARYWLDSFRLHTMDGDEVVAASTGEGLHHVDAFRDSGRGGIFATGHLGSWDVGAFFTSQRRWGMVVVAEVVEPRRLFERFVELRRAAGIDVIPLVRGGDMLDRLEARITDEGALATLLADRDLTRKGPIVEFFGEPCRLPPGTAALARRTGRPVCIGAFLTEGDGFRGVVHAPIEVAELDVYDGTQEVAAELEKLIERYPDQWHVFVRNWLADREPDHPVVAAWQRGEDWRSLARTEWAERRRPSGAAELAPQDPSDTPPEAEA